MAVKNGGGGGGGGRGGGGEWCFLKLTQKIMHT